jgi:hypothetical protein
MLKMFFTQTCTRMKNESALLCGDTPYYYYCVYFCPSC